MACCRSLATLAVAVPAYQFVMLLVDALMALVLKYLLFGPLAPGGGGTLPAIGGAAYAVTAAVAVAGSGGEIIALATFCYLVTYLFLAVYVACKTPRLVAVFLKGAGAGGAFLSTFATGLIAGASTALATAAVGGGGIAGGLLGGGGFRGGGGMPAPPSLSPGGASLGGNGRKPGGLSPANRPGHVVLSPAPAVRSRPAPPIQRGLERDGPVRIAHVHREPRGHLARRRFRDRPQGLGAAAKAKRERRGRPPEGRRESGKGVGQAEPGQDFENLTGLANGTLAEA